MPKTQIRSDKLRQPSGVFSHVIAIEAKGRLVFISGMVARRLDGSMAGATGVRSANLRSSQLRKHRDEARAKAIQAAREKATAFANELGAKAELAQPLARR